MPEVTPSGLWRSLARWFRRRRVTLPFWRRKSRGRFLAARFDDSQTARSIAYRLYLPASTSRRRGLPLVVMLHGCKQDATSFAAGTRMNELAEEERFAVLYPEQDQRSNPLRCWNWFDVAALEGQGEALTIARLVERISARRVIDPQRVSVVGMSAGGAMACILSARHGRLFTACAVHSGLMYGAANSVIQALTVMRSGPSVAAIERAQELLRAATEIVVPTLVIQGDHDTTVHPSNAPAIIAQLRSRTEVIDSITLARLDEHRIEDRGRPYRQQDYVRGRQVILREILIEGLGHAWSGGDPRHPFNDAAGPDASRLIVSFVTAQRPLA